MSARTFYNAVRTAAYGVAGVSPAAVTEDDQSVLSGEHGPMFAVIIREVEGEHRLMEIGSNADTGSFRVPADFYASRMLPRQVVKDFWDAAATALGPAALASGTRPIVRVQRIPRATAQATSPECEVAGYLRTRLVVAADEL